MKECEWKWFINPGRVIEAFPDTLSPLGHCLPGLVQEERPLWTCYNDIRRETGHLGSYNLAFLWCLKFYKYVIIPIITKPSKSLSDYFYNPYFGDSRGGAQGDGTAFSSSPIRAKMRVLDPALLTHWPALATVLSGPPHLYTKSDTPGHRTRTTELSTQLHIPTSDLQVHCGLEDCPSSKAPSSLPSTTTYHLPPTTYQSPLSQPVCFYWTSWPFRNSFVWSLETEMQKLICKNDKGYKG